MRSENCQQVVCFAELHIRNRLSEICLALQRPNEVLKWVNSVCMMLRAHDNYPGLRTLEAKLHYQFAWASHQMDVRCRAPESIKPALNLDPDNDLYKRVQRDWLEEEAQRPHEHGGAYPEACKGSSSWKLAQHTRMGNSVHNQASSRRASLP